MRAFALALTFLLAACQNDVVTTSPTAMPTAVQAPSAKQVSPAPSITAPPIAPPLHSYVPSDLPSGVLATGLGRLSGDVAFVLRRPTRSPPSDSIAELWAVPLDGRAPTIAVRYVTQFGDVTQGPDENLLPRQFSPDGKRVILQVSQPRVSGGWRWGLVIVDLESGSVTPLGRDDGDQDVAPAWSPDGEHIAYRRRWMASISDGMFDDGLWVMTTASTGVRQILPPQRGLFTDVAQWVPDGSGVAFIESWEQAGYGVVDVATRKVTGVPFGPQSVGSQLSGWPVDAWRAGMPAFVGAFNSGGYTPETFAIEVADHVGAPRRGIVRTSDTAHTGDVPLGPEWRPRADELLYLRSGAIHIVDATGLNERSVPTSLPVGAAVWTPDGSEIIYVERSTVSPRAMTLHAIRTDGTNERVVVTLPTSPFDITSFNVMTYR